jgi:hypothetical protein
MTQDAAPGNAGRDAQARTFLKRVLGRSVVPACEVHWNADQCEIPWRSVLRAKRQLGVVVISKSWRLPGDGDGIPEIKEKERSSKRTVSKMVRGEITKRARAILWEMLTPLGREVPVLDIRRRAELEGISFRTIEGVKERLGIESLTHRYQGPHFWRMPQTPDKGSL